MPSSGDQTPDDAASTPPVGLLVEDDADLLPVTEQILQHLGFQVQAFADSDAALRWFRNNSASTRMIMLDRRLPGIGGGALFRVMHAMAPQVPIIVYSGDISTQEETQLLSEGVSQVLRKPLGIRQFRDAVSALCPDVVGDNGA